MTDNASRGCTVLYNASGERVQIAIAVRG